MVPPNNAQAFANGLIKLVDDDNYRMNAGQNARKFAEANFSRIKLADDLYRFLKKFFNRLILNFGYMYRSF